MLSHKMFNNVYAVRYLRAAKVVSSWLLPEVVGDASAKITLAATRRTIKTAAKYEAV